MPPLVPVAVTPAVAVSEDEKIDEMDGLGSGLMENSWDAVAGRGIKSPVVPENLSSSRFWSDVVESVYWRALVSTPGFESL